MLGDIYLHVHGQVVLGECSPSNRDEPTILIAVHTNDGQEALRF
jgi:hypothetical protein